MNLKDTATAEASQFHIDVNSPTQLVDAVQLALLGHQFTDDEISLIERLVAVRQAASKKDLRRRLRAAPEPADTLQSLTTAVQKLNEFLDDNQQSTELPQRPVQQQPTYQSPSPQSGRTTSRSIKL